MPHGMSEYRLLSTPVGNLLIWAHNGASVGWRTEWAHNAPRGGRIPADQISETVTINRVEYSTYGTAELTEHGWALGYFSMSRRDARNYAATAASDSAKGKWRLILTECLDAFLVSDEGREMLAEGQREKTAERRKELTRQLEAARESVAALEAELAALSGV